MAEKISETQFLGSVFEGNFSVSSGYITRDQILESAIRKKISIDNKNLNLNHIEFEIETDNQSPDYASLDYLPTLVFGYKTLRKLLACDNEIKILPLEIGNLSNLEELDLSNNLITVLPKEIGKLSNLKYLNLSDNRLSSLPAEMKQLINLKCINISKNDLPPSFYRNLPRIEELIDDN